MNEPISQPSEDLPSRIINELRSASFDAGNKITFTPADIIKVATETDLRNSFLQKFRNEINDQDLKSAIIEFVEDIIESLESTNDNTETYVELIDRTSLPIATTAVLSGIGLLVSVGLTVGPIAILVGGAAGMAITGTGRTFLRLNTNKNKADIKKLRKFVVKLRSL